MPGERRGSLGRWAAMALVAVLAALPVASGVTGARSKRGVTAHAPVKAYGISTAPITIEATAHRPNIEAKRMSRTVWLSPVRMD